MVIYEPGEDSELLLKYVKKYAFGRVLDVGTGSGVQAIGACKLKKVNSVLAVDINEEVVRELRKKKSKGIKILESNLFAKVIGKFDTIVFNPPYLPYDSREDQESQVATTGGKKGYEILEKFLNSVNDHLTEQGIVLIVFSSLTKKEKVDAIISENLLGFKELERKHISFEDLYVYKIVKSEVLRELEKKGVRKISYLAHGKRGNVFMGVYGKKKVAIKIKRVESKAMGRMKNEVSWLRVLNRHQIGPKLLFFGKNYLVYEFVRGEFLVDWLQKAKKEEKKEVLQKVLQQCFKLDQLGVNKEEMHRPIKHVIVNKAGKVVLIDFERCYETKKPHNVTQMGHFLMNNKLVSKGKMVKLLQNYKKELNQLSFKKILELL